MTKAFLIDIDKCSGCHNCQVSCKDEHCEQPWLPIADAQPLIGSFWCNVKEYERGRTPVVTVTYVPVICNHCDMCELLRVGKGAVYRRKEDGLVIIDPEKAKGRKDLVDACPLHAVYWNEELQLPQKCTGCAHLLDDGWTVPRCVDSCCHEAILFDDVENFDLDGTEFLEEVAGLRPHVYYRNLPRRFAAGCVYDPDINDVIIGAKVVLTDITGNVVSEMETDYMGDWKFEQIDPGVYHVHIESEGYEPFDIDVDVTEKDVFVGDYPMTFFGDEKLREREVYDPPRSLHSRERRPVVYEDDDDGFLHVSAATRIRELMKHPQCMEVIERIFPPAADHEWFGQFAAQNVKQYHNGCGGAMTAEQLAQIDKELKELVIPLKVEWNTDCKINDIAANPEAAAIVNEIMPGFLVNDGVMKNVGGMSFNAVAAIAPDQFTPELIAALDAGFAKLNRPKIALDVKIAELAAIPEAAAVINNVMPGFLDNDSVMSQVGGMSFEAVAGMAPDMFPEELVNALAEGFAHAYDD